MTEEKEIIKLEEKDWDILLPATEHMLGSTTLYLTPLSVGELTKVIQTLTNAISDWKEVSFELPVNKDGKVDPEALKTNINQLVGLIVKLAETKIPVVLEKLSRVDKSDISKLPFQDLLSLFSACIDVNVGSLKALEKNLPPLSQMIMGLTQGIKINREVIPEQNGEKSSST